MEKGKAVGTEENKSNSRKLEKVDAIIKQLACSNPSILSYQEEIKQKLCNLPLSHPPDHPTYAFMIERAITELNEEDGSSEEAISKFIEAKYKDLPHAHLSLLSHHLEVLVKKEDIVCTPNNCYKLQDENIDSSTELKHEQKHKQKRSMKNQVRQHKVEEGQSQEQQNVVSEVENPTYNEENGTQGHQPDEFEDQHESQEEQIESSKKQKQEVTDSKIYTEERQIEVIEKQTQVHGQPVEGVVDDKKQADESLAHEKGLEVSEENNQAQGKELEGIGDQKQQEEQVESIQKQKEAGLVELIEEQNDANEKDQQLGELNEQQSQVLKQQIEVLAEERNQAEKKIEGTEDPQGEVEDEVIEEQCHKEDQHESPEEQIETSKKQKQEVTDRQIHTEEQQIEVIEKQTQVHGQPIEGVVDDQKQADESLTYEKGPEVGEENNHSQGKESEGIGDQKKAKEQVESIEKQEEAGLVELIVEQNDANERDQQLGELIELQSQVLKQQIEVLAEQRNEAEKKIEVTEEPQGGVDDKVIEECDKEDQHQSQEEQIETSKKQRREMTDREIHTEEQQIEVIEKRTQVHGQPIEGVVDDEKQADESLTYEKRTEVGEENNQARGKELEGIGDQKQAEEQVESFEKQKEAGLVELIVEQNDGNEKDQQLGELNEPQSQVLKQQIEVLAEECNKAEKKIEVTEELQVGVEDEVMEEECDKDEQRSEATEEKNQPHDKQVKDIAEQVQSQEMKIPVIKEQDKRQGQQNELTEEQKWLGEQQMEICCKIMDLNNVMEQFTKKREENEASVTTPSSSLTCQKSDHFGSLLLSKKECIELLRKANKIQGQLIEIVGSLTVMEVPEHNTFQPMIREPNKFLGEHLLTKSPCTGKECMLPNLKRPPEVEVTTLEEFCQKQNKQSKFCGQQVMPKSQPKSMGISLHVCTNPSLENAPQRVFGDVDRIADFNSTTEADTYIQGEAAVPVKAMKKTSLNAPMELKENDLEQQSEHPRKERPPEEYQQRQSDLQNLKMSLEAKVSTVEKEVTNSAVIFNSEDVEHYQQLDPFLSETFVDHQLPNSERPPDLKLIVEQLSQGQQHCDKVDQEQQPENSIEERRREHELTAVNQACQMQQQSRPQDKKPSDSEVAHQQQRQLCPQCPWTAVMTDLGVPLASLKSRLKQNAKSPICNGPPEPRPVTVGELSISAEQQVNHHGVPVLVQTQQQQTWGSGQGRITRGRAAAATAMEGPSQPKPAVDKTIAEQYEQQKQGRGRPRISNSDVNNAEGESLPINDQQQQPLSRGRGRPPKIKPGTRTGTATGTTMDALLPPQHMDQREEKQVQGRGRGRCPQPEQPTDTTEDSLLPLQYQQPEQQPHDQGKMGPTKSNPSTVTVTDTLLSSQQLQKQTQSLGQGMSTRARAAAAIVASLQQQQPQYKGRGRPPKRKYDSDSTTNNLLTSQNDQQRPKRQGRGRPPKVD